jgi:hypothetical protein
MAAPTSARPLVPAPRASEEIDVGRGDVGLFASSSPSVPSRPMLPGQARNRAANDEIAPEMKSA